MASITLNEAEGMKRYNFSNRIDYVNNNRLCESEEGQCGDDFGFATYLVNSHRGKKEFYRRPTIVFRRTPAEHAAEKARIYAERVAESKANQGKVAARQ